MVLTKLGDLVFMIATSRRQPPLESHPKTLNHKNILFTKIIKRYGLKLERKKKFVE